MRPGLIALLALAGCGRASARWPDSGVYAGYYTYGYELSEFVPSGTTEKWSLDGYIPCATDKVVSLSGGSPVVYVAVRGRLSAVGKYGHLAAYSREVTALEVLDCRELRNDEKPKF